MYDEYINPELIILVPVLNILGAILKNSKVKDHYIPICLSLVSILLSSLYILILHSFSFINIFHGIVQGLLCSSTSVYVNQLVKQANKDK